MLRIRQDKMSRVKNKPVAQSKKRYEEYRENDADLLLRVRKYNLSIVKNGTDLLLRVRQDKKSIVSINADLLLGV